MDYKIEWLHFQLYSWFSFRVSYTIRSDINKEHYKVRTSNYKKALLRTICDYIAGMTDKYIMDRHEEFYNITC